MTFPAPLYLAPGGPVPSRRILLVSPAFPPCAEVGALRWEKITLVAATRGWGIDIITGAAAPSDRMDHERLLNLPAGTRVWSIPLPVPMVQQLWRGIESLSAPRRGPTRSEPIAHSPGGESPRAIRALGAHSLVSPLVRNLRAATFFSAWKQWGDAVLSLAQAIHREAQPVLVASSGPPHMAHEAARRLAKAAGIPFVIDLRDPWFVDHAEPEDLAGSIWRRRTAALEAHACAAASLIVVNTEACAALMRARYAPFASRVMTVLNGADPEVADYGGMNSETFDIVHTGNLYGGRNPRPLFLGIRRFLDELGPAANVVRVKFVGADHYAGVPLHTVAGEHGLGEHFSTTPFLRRQNALTLSGRAAVNVVLPQSWHYSIPSKVFEYMQFPAWILALSEREDAISELLRGTSAAPLAPGDTTGIAAFLTKCYGRWERGIREEPLNRDGRYDRVREVNRLLDAFDVIAPGPGSSYHAGLARD